MAIPTPAPLPEARPRSPRRATSGLLAVAVLAGALAVFFSPALASGDQFLFRDTGRMHHPVKAFVADELRQGRLPLWNPYMGLGVPLAGSAVDAVQHPFNLLLALLPFEAGFKAWVLLSYLLAGAGTFLLGRQLGLSFSPALGAALAFALSGFLVSSSDNLTYLTAASAVPWLLAAFEAYLARGGPLRWTGVAAASFLLAAAGDPQAWGIAAAVLLGRGAVAAVAGRGRSPALRRTGLAAVVAAAGASPVFLPVALWLPATRRMANGLDATSVGRWDLHPLRALELLLPSLFESGTGEVHGGVFQAFAGNETTSLPWVASIYVGVACVALAGLAAVRSRRARLLLGAALLFTWAATGHYLGFTALAAHVPVLGSFRYWEKLTLWPTLFLALAAGIGLERLLGERRPALRFAAATGAAAAVLLLAWGGLRLGSPALQARLTHPGVAPADAAQLLHNLARATRLTGVVLLLLALAALALGRGLLARAAPLVFVGILALDAASANVRAYVLAPPELVQPDAAFTRWLKTQGELARVLTPYEFERRRWTELSDFESTWRWGASTLAACWHVAARVGNLEAYTALSPDRLSRFRLEAKNDRLVPQAGLWGVQYLVVPVTPALAEKVGLPPPHAVAAVDPELPAFLVRLPHRPRAYLAGEVDSTDADGARAFALDPASVRSPRSVIEGPLPAGVVAGPPGPARIVAEENGRVEVEVEPARLALLVLSDQFAPGWRAEVDGQPRPIAAANYLARGVWVEPGRHRVVFTYRAPGLREGWLLLALALAATGAWGLAGARGGRRRGGAATAIR
jgi:hypothetical protein